MLLEELIDAGYKPDLLILVGFSPLEKSIPSTLSSKLSKLSKLTNSPCTMSRKLTSKEEVA